MPSKIFFKNSRKQRLAGILFQPRKRADSLVIFCHGFKSAKETSKTKPLAILLNRQGIALMAFDFSGVGQSEGKFEDTTISNYIDDLQAAISWGTHHFKNIGIVGSSLGGFVALQAAIKNSRIDAMALLAPVSTFPWRRDEEFSAANTRLWHRRGWITVLDVKNNPQKLFSGFLKDAAKYRGYKRYARIDVPVLIAHGTKDEKVSFTLSKRLVRSLPQAILFPVPGGDHRFTAPGHLERILKMSTVFLAGCVG